MADRGSDRLEELRRCLGCGYDLTGLAGRRCPECGRPFDPADPATFRAAPPGHRFERLCLVIAALNTAVLASVVWAGIPAGVAAALAPILILALFAEETLHGDHGLSHELWLAVNLCRLQLAAAALLLIGGLGGVLLRLVVR